MQARQTRQSAHDTQQATEVTSPRLESNAAQCEQLQVTPGPFTPVLNAALSEAFGMSVSGISADFGCDADNAAIGAVASTEGSNMRFGSGQSEDLADASAMESIAHETAHALAGGGSGATELDQAGDAGEAAADTAGKQFAAWAAGGMEGPAPSLSPATGGEARIHRQSEDGVDTDTDTDTNLDTDTDTDTDLDTETEQELAEARAEYQAFMNANHALEWFRPSTGLGNFDFDYTPKADKAAVKVRLAFDFTSANYSRLAEHVWEGDKEALDECFWGTDVEKEMWKLQFIEQVETSWSEQHALFCDSTDERLAEVGPEEPNYSQLFAEVEVDIVDTNSNPHYAVTVQKIPDTAFEVSWVRAPMGPTLIDEEGESSLDTEDIDHKQKSGGHLQRASIHEFGHMLGLPDEYEREVDGHTVGNNDARIMSCGEAVEAGHYSTVLEAIAKATNKEWST